jgi:hypothetical protein
LTSGGPTATARSGIGSSMLPPTPATARDSIPVGCCVHGLRDRPGKAPGHLGAPLEIILREWVLDREQRIGARQIIEKLDIRHPAYPPPLKPVRCRIHIIEMARRTVQPHTALPSIPCPFRGGQEQIEVLGRIRCGGVVPGRTASMKGFWTIALPDCRMVHNRQLAHAATFVDPYS